MSKASIESFRVRGFNSDLDAGTEDIDPTGALALPAAAAETTIESAAAADAAAGTGAHTVFVRGLVAGGAVASETVTLTGTVAVELANEYLRILDAHVATAGSGGTNAGALTLQHSTTVIGTIPAGEAALNRAAYTVPANRRGRVLSWSCAAGVAEDGVLTFRLMARPAGGAFRVLDEVEVADVTPGLPVVRDLGAGIVLEGLTDVKVVATSSAADMDARADIQGTVEADF